MKVWKGEHKGSVVYTQKAFGRASRQGRVIVEHRLGPLLLDAAHGGGLLPQHLIQVLHDLELMSPLVLLPREVASALWGALGRGRARGWRGARRLRSELVS